MGEKLLNWFMQLLTGMPNWLIVGIVSMVPLIELRGGLIAAALLGMPLWEGILFCLIGNIIPVPFILLFITPIFRWLKTTKLFRPLVEKIEARSMGKSDKIRKAEFWGLVLFVGIPLPGTGAWTGSLIACLLNVDKKKAFCAVILGLLLATTIMCVFTYGIPAIVASVK
jgi:uncharacterized membrane protein